MVWMTPMAKETAPRPRRRKAAEVLPPARRPLWRRGLWWAVRGLSLAVLALVAWVALLAVVNPPRNAYMRAEAHRLGGIAQDWVAWDEIAPVMARSVVAAEDANYCLHWGFDMGAIRQALDAGGTRGASTITQQVVKNVFLWHDRSWTRKALEAALTPVVEVLWSKRRILEVYLNIAEFDEGVFGVKAASERYFGIAPDALSAVQAARLAMVLPNPKDRSAARPTPAQRGRAARILDGAETIRLDGRAACFEGG